MSPVGFEPTISAGERPQTRPLDRAATATGVAVGSFVNHLTPNVHFSGRTAPLQTLHFIYLFNKYMY
jgi:3-deoxy-D-manno-octulosonic acid (KDO) 8-phosphate synthase